MSAAVVVLPDVHCGGIWCQVCARTPYPRRRYSGSLDVVCDTSGGFGLLHPRVYTETAPVKRTLPIRIQDGDDDDSDDGDNADSDGDGGDNADSDGGGGDNDSDDDSDGDGDALVQFPAFIRRASRDAHVRLERDGCSHSDDHAQVWVSILCRHHQPVAGFCMISSVSSISSLQHERRRSFLPLQLCCQESKDVDCGVPVAMSTRTAAIDTLDAQLFVEM